MKQKLNVGYVGCGVMGQVYLQAAQSIPFIHSAAVADTVEASARKAAETFGVPAVYTDAEAMFADPNVDAVVLALPAIARTELAIQAFRAGKHVLTEKPAARNANEVRRLIQEQGGLIAGCASSRTRLLDSAAIVAETLAQHAADYALPLADWSQAEAGSDAAVVAFLQGCQWRRQPGQSRYVHARLFPWY